MKTIDEICQILVSGALDDTKKMGKAGADIFAKSGPEKPSTKIRTNQTILRDFPRVFWKVDAWLGLSVKVATLFFHQVGEIWVW